MDRRGVTPLTPCHTSHPPSIPQPPTEPCYIATVADFGRYRIVSRLGKGGMAEVFEGVARGADGFERRVAIKRILDTAVEDETACRMFLDEARIASQLHHGNIVSVLDYGLADGLPFQVLEYVDGIDGSRLLSRAAEHEIPVPAAIALYLCTEVAHALAYAHDARDSDGEPLGIVHRDVKPSNLLVAWSGDVRLADFGIAWAENRAEQTATGVTKGTLLFMAPEQATQGTIDGRTDVFALGCVLHTLLTGRSPLAGDEALFQLLSGKELTLDDQLDPDIRAIIARAVRRSRSERHDSASAMADALGQALTGRIARDPRGFTRQWLERLRAPGSGSSPGSPRPRAGKLDDLLDVGLLLGTSEPASEPAPDSASEPAPEPASDATGSTATTAAAMGFSPTALGTPGDLVDRDAASVAENPAPAGERRRWPIVSLAAAIAVAGVALAIGYMVGSPSSPAPAPAPADVEPVTVPSTERPANTSTAAPIDVAISSPPASHDSSDHAPGDAVVSRETPVVAAERAPEAARESLGSRRRAATASRRDGRSKRSRDKDGSSDRTSLPSTTSQKPDPEPRFTGWVRIGGSGAHRAQIRIDGKRKGYAPKLLELSGGKHTIELRGEDGASMATKRVAIEPHHTRSRPAEWIVPGSPSSSP